MFQLENAIQNWRSSLLQNHTVTDADVDELQSHLRDEMDSLMLAGFSDEEAFMVASHRIGNPQQVVREFAKVNPSRAWRHRTFWMLMGILVSMLVSGLAGVCSAGGAALMMWLNLNAAVSGVLSVLIHIGVFLVLLTIAVVGIGLFSRAIRNRLTVAAFLVTSVVGILVLKAVYVVFQSMGVRLMGAETFSRIAIASAYTQMAWQVLWPVLVMVLLLVLWSSRPQRIH